MIEPKVSAIEDLTSLIREGFLETSVKLPYRGKEWEFKMRTVTILDESKAMRAAGLSGPPENAAQEISYVICLLPYAIYMINNEEAMFESTQFLTSIMTADMIGDLYDVYKKIGKREIKAVDELKNS